MNSYVLDAQPLTARERHNERIVWVHTCVQAATCGHVAVRYNTSAAAAVRYNTGAAAAVRYNTGAAAAVQLYGCRLDVAGLRYCSGCPARPSGSQTESSVHFEEVCLFKLRALTSALADNRSVHGSEASCVHQGIEGLVLQIRFGQVVGAHVFSM
jgi:hypothetical protein